MLETLPGAQPPLSAQASNESCFCRVQGVVPWIPSFSFKSKWWYPESICYSYSLAFGVREYNLTILFKSLV